MRIATATASRLDGAFPVAPSPTVEQNGTNRNTFDPPSKNQNPPQPPQPQPDASRNTPQNPPTAPTPLQARALDLLLQGHTDSRIARALGIGRTTLHRCMTF